MSKTQPLVSVIIACKNNAQYIRQSLNSLKNQTYTNWELIIVDNYSTDGTFEIAKEYTDKVYQLGPERSTQFNYGFTQSKGSLIYRIGAEFELEPDVIEKCVAKIQEGYDAVAIHNRSHKSGIWSQVRYYERESYRGDNTVVAVRFWKREVFEAVGGFDENLVANEDFDLHNRIVERGYRWTHVDAIEVHLGEPKNILEVWNKFYYYGRTIGNYIKKDKQNKKHINIIRPSFRNIYKMMYKEGGISLFCAFWMYMGVKFIAGGVGYLVGPPKTLNNKDIFMLKSVSSKKPLVSVIIPTYNSSRTLERCLQSIKDQTYSHIELIVVDNNSTDNTKEIAKKFTDKVYNKGPERSAQRNYGVKKSKGEYVLVHDSDIYFHPHSVQECVDAIELKTYGALILPEKSIGEGYWVKVKAFERSFYVGNDYIEAARFFPLDIYQQLGGYDESLTGPEDWDLTVRIRELGLKIGRTQSFLEHDEGRIDLFGSSKKKQYYAKDMFSKYAHKHPEYFHKQMNFFVRFPISKLIIKGIRHPILLISMVLMKGLEYWNSKRV